MAVRAGGGRERYLVKSAFNSAASLVPAYPYPTAGLDLAFVVGRYLVNGTPYFDLPSMITGVGGTFTRATSATYFDSTGTLQTAASGVPRIGIVPGLTTRPGYLAEEARTNLIVRSEEFDNANWPKTTVTVTADATTAPDGTISADLLTATGADSNIAQVSITAIAATAYTFSVYMRASSAQTVSIFLTDGGGGSGNTSAICNVTTSWQRFTVTRTTSALTTLISAQIGGAGTFSTGEAVFAWGGQVEQGAFASSYIKTIAAPVARNADILSIPTTGWYNASAGSFYAEFLSFDATSTIQRPFSASNGTTANLHEQIFNGTGNSTVAQLVSGATRVAGGVGGQTPANAINKFAHGADASGVTSAANGNTFSALVSSDTMPTITTLHIGNRVDGLRPMNGFIHRIFYLPTRQADAVIQGWTV